MRPFEAKRRPRPHKRIKPRFAEREPYLVVDDDDAENADASR